MAEYIDRAAAVKSVLRMRRPENSVAQNRMLSIIQMDMLKLPAADVSPVVHGHFVHDGPRFAGGVDWWHCSSCGRLVSGVETRFDYCPHCGAKMDGGDDRV